MPAEGRGPDLRQARKVTRPRRLADGPATPLETVVRKLQTSLQTKAKAEPDFRFYALWDKVCRADVLEEAYRACRRNDGAPGCDGMTFDQIATHGQDRWLGKSCGRSCVTITIGRCPCCACGYQRAMGVSARLAYRASAQTAWSRWRRCWCWARSSRRTCCAISMASVRGWTPRWRHRARPSGDVSDHGRSEIVDADLSDYFSSIPHGLLMRCVSRRVADGTLLSVIKRWLTAPVIERDQRTTRCTTGGKGSTSRDRRRAPRSRPYWRTPTSVVSFWPGNDLATENSFLRRICRQLRRRPPSSAADLEMDRQHWRQ